MRVFNVVGNSTICHRYGIVVVVVVVRDGAYRDDGVAAYTFNRVTVFAGETAVDEESERKNNATTTTTRRGVSRRIAAGVRT